MAGFRGNAILKRLPEAPLACTAVEVGVGEGTTSGWLLGWHRHLDLVMVDPWAVASPGSSWVKTGDPAAKGGQAKHDRKMRLAIARTERAADRRTVLRMSSVHAANAITDGTVDLVFIDGDHSREAVAMDIEAWLPKVRANGWLGGHDYMRHGSYPGVHEAVDARFGEAVTLDEDSTWWVRVTGR